jgi:hypothetical protein
MDTRELRELAKRATPGPWKVCDANVPDSAGIGVRTINDGTGDGGYIICDLCSDTDYDQEANAEYIAALSPDVLEWLCDKAERLRDALRECVDASITDFDTCCVCLGDVTKHSAGCVIECAAALLVESTQPAPDQKGKL